MPEVEAVDYFISYAGPFSAGSEEKIVEYKIKNVGALDAYSGEFSFEAAQLNADGQIMQLICRRGNDDVVSVGGCIQFNGPVDNPCRDELIEDCSVIPNGYILIKMPDTIGSYYYGIKTWGKDEDEPSYPVPDSPDQPLNAKAWSVTVEAPAPPCTCTSWVNAECTAPGKRRQTRMCTPAGCDIENSIIDDSTCVPPEGTLSITTSPMGASIMVDGVTKTSPCIFSLAQEIYTVTITKAGYDTIMDNVNIIAGATTTKSYTLTLSKKIITFESVPAGATVKVV